VTPKRIKSEEVVKGFNKYLKDKGIDLDEDYHWLSEAEQKKIKEEYNNKDKEQPVIEDWKNTVTTEEEESEKDPQQEIENEAAHN